MGSLVESAQGIAAQLRAAGIAATADPAWAATHRPCVLVAPPAMDYVARLNTWRLAILASHPAGTLAALEQLDQLLQLVVDVVNAEAADPGTYQLSPDAGGTVPAYIVRFTN